MSQPFVSPRRLEAQRVGYARESRFFHGQSRTHRNFLYAKLNERRRPSDHPCRVRIIYRANVCTSREGVSWEGREDPWRQPQGRVSRRLDVVGVYRLSTHTPTRANRARRPIPIRGCSTALYQSPAKRLGNRKNVTASVANVRRRVIVFPWSPTARQPCASTVSSARTTCRATTCTPVPD